MVRIKKRRLETVRITEFSKEWHGSGSIEVEGVGTRGVEVPFAIPGDEVVAEIYGKQKGVYQASLQSLLVPSPQRQAPRCPHFTSCGGCALQQIPYQQQASLKELFVKRAFKDVDLEGVSVLPIVSCDAPWEYRNKMEFSFSSDRAGNRYLGLNSFQGRGRVTNLSECHLCTPWFTQTLAKVRAWWEEAALEAYFGPADRGALRTLTLREGKRSGDRLAMLTVSGHPDYRLNAEQKERFVEAIRQGMGVETQQSIYLRTQNVAKGVPTTFDLELLSGSDHLRERLEVLGTSLEFQVGPTDFFQPNSLQAEKLYSIALQMSEITTEQGVYDLYCGTGTLGLCAARSAAWVIGIELSPEAVVSANQNGVRNGITNYQALCGDVGKELERLEREEGRHPEIVIVDPPRVGLDSTAIAALLRLAAPRIVYVSCNPVSQAANVKELIAGGYRLLSLCPVDQFPHTRHIENVVVLSKE